MVAIVIVTFNRQSLLQQLLESIEKMVVKPTRVIVVNNASTDQTRHILDQWASAKHDYSFDSIHLPTNTGGAGGFRTGIERALATDDSWIWVMDDDVEIVPDALDLASKWFDRFDAFMGRRLSSDGEIVNWSHKLSNRTGLAPILPRDPFKQVDFVQSNSGCFEGMFISTKAARGTGLPDPRFFITWDDAIYGWLLSQRYEVAYVKDVFLRRTIDMKSVGTSAVRIYARNNLSRYYFVRNRAIQAKYFEGEGRLHKIWFALGTIRVLLIEFMRSLAVERDPRSIAVIIKGAVDGRAIRRDAKFTVPDIGE